MPKIKPQTYNFDIYVRTGWGYNERCYCIDSARGVDEESALLKARKSIEKWKRKFGDIYYVGEFAKIDTALTGKDPR